MRTAVALTDDPPDPTVMKELMDTIYFEEHKEMIAHISRAAFVRGHSRGVVLGIVVGVLCSILLVLLISKK